MLSIKKRLKLFVLLGCMFFAASMNAATNDDLISLEAEMLKYIDTNDREAFTRAAEKLKTASKVEGDERMFYKALEDLNELSFYESKTELPLTNSVKINKLCNHLTNNIQTHCHKGVTTIFQTDFADDFEIRTNSQALEKLLVHLLNDAARFTEKGMIWLKCADLGEYVRFSITDTSNTDAEEDNGRFTDMNINICQSISRLLHGRIWRDTEYTNGIRFIFEIPTNSITDNNTN